MRAGVPLPNTCSMSKKRAGSKLLPSQLGRLDIRQLTDESDEDVARSRGAGQKRDARCARKRTALRSNHSMDTVDNTHKGHIHTPPGIQIRFRPIRRRQNAAPKQKRMPLPPVQLREVFSSSLLFSLRGIKQAGQRKVSDLFRGDFLRISCNAHIFAKPPVGDLTQT